MRHSRRINKESGFTLVEMSIVLVIIGLIVSGVLVGQDLIEAARNRATVTQVQGYDAAVNTFMLKYRLAPGDLGNPSNTFNAAGGRAADFLGVGALEGDGDGQIEEVAAPVANPTNFAGEIGSFWNHLGLSGMVGSTYTAVTSGAIAGGTHLPIADTGRGLIFSAFMITPDTATYTGTLTPLSTANYWFIGGGNGGASAALTNVFGATSGLNPAQAYSIDEKLDDGLSSSGSVRTTTDIDGALPADGVCHVTRAGGIYNLQSEALDCQLIIRMSGI